jgi:hypothetical protein
MQRDHQRKDVAALLETNPYADEIEAIKEHVAKDRWRA